MRDMQVRIRRSLEATSRYLTTTSLDKLDTVIPTIKRWGIPDEQSKDLTGQIVIGDEGNDSSAYFEIIVEDEDE